MTVPAIIDRVIQEILRILIEPIMEAQFFKHSYGFRPMRDAHMALERTTDVCHKTGYHWIIEGDIRGCFDNINHTKLIKQLWHMGIHDRRILMIVKKMLKAGVMNESRITEVGTPQGGIISPLLANVFLHKLDQWIVREWEEKKTRHEYHPNSRNKELNKTNLKPAYLVRYADDWILVTNSKSNAEKWKRHIENYLDNKLKLKLSPEKTLITNVKKNPIQFLGYSYKQVPGKSRTGWIPRTRPNDKRLKAKVEELRKRTKTLRKLNAEQLVHQINDLNSALIGIGNYYQPATWVNIELNRYADSLKYTAFKALKPKGGKWTPANICSNLPLRHKDYTTQIPAIKYKDLTIGVTSLGFVKWRKVYQKNLVETPYTPEGRKAHYERTLKRERLARDDITMSLTLSHLIARGLTEPKYNFEYLMNRGYAFNRDKGKCKICGEPIIGYELETHHINPKLPIDQINKVNNLASTHQTCHKLIHCGQDVLKLVGKKAHKKIIKFRERLKLEAQEIV
ncbi:group II intron reverse transcriptase [Desulfosporosinus acidiphilus]|uniref:group II intron reverse transcriptase n=1 Tax=Desulfosporosinus acidiphilus TaxID=885581 RepID=UPI0002D8AC5C|nr:reverse transcriptase domain-containing protein [Desulfosporosinus acidiphilus]